MSTLLLRLAGPMQSWGSSSLYDRRDTEYYPTKSGVLGMIAGALGRKRGESLDDLRALRFGVRIDEPGKRMEDFHCTEMHTETEVYNSNLSRRYYLTDAVFLVGLESDDDEMLLRFKTALENPVYTPFLGRRSCPPAGPIVVGFFADKLEDILRGADWLLSDWRQQLIFRMRDHISLRILVEDIHADTMIRDNPVSYSPFKRQYAYRGIRECAPKVIFAPTDATELDEIELDGIYTTEMDPMQELV